MPGMAVVEARPHAEVQELGDDREERLSCPPCCVASDVTRRDLAVQRRARPESSGMVRGKGHCDGTPPEPGAGPMTMASDAARSSIFAIGAADRAL